MHPAIRHISALILLFFAAVPEIARAQSTSSKHTEVSAPLTMPPTIGRLTWLGGGGPWYDDPIIPPLLRGIGATWARSTFGYGETNNDTFAWRYVQGAGPKTWDWTHADKQVAYLGGLSLQTIVQLNQGEDPPWAKKLSQDDYVAAKAAFINKLALRYRGKIWGIEPENEPHPWDGGPPGSWTGYDRHLALLRACQRSRQYTKLVGWACQGPFEDWLSYLTKNGLTNLCDAISWHLYCQIPPDQSLRQKPADGTYDGRLDQWMRQLRTQVGEMPIVVDELGLEPAVPMRMAKILIMLRAYHADIVQLQCWGYGRAPGELAAFNSDTRKPYPHAVITAWTAYWLGNRTCISLTTDGNVFAFSYGDRTFAWCLEGTQQACSPTGWSRITDIYGRTIVPTQLTDAVTVFHGTGRLGLAESSPEVIFPSNRAFHK